MALSPAPDLIDKQEAFAAFARAAAERPPVGQNSPFPPSTGGDPYQTYALPENTPGGLLGPAPTPRQQNANALLPNGSVRLDGQVYRWAELSDGSGAWIVVVGG